MNEVKLSKYKTVMCQSMITSGNCRYGSQCDFAHDEKELRRSLRTTFYYPSKEGCMCGGSDLQCQYAHNDMEVLYHPYTYKTSHCHAFSQHGSCSRDRYCSHAHGVQELRRPHGEPSHPRDPSSVSQHLKLKILDIVDQIAVVQSGKAVQDMYYERVRAVAGIRDTLDRIRAANAVMSGDSSLEDLSYDALSAALRHNEAVAERIKSAMKSNNHGQKSLGDFLGSSGSGYHHHSPHIDESNLGEYVDGMVRKIERALDRMEPQVTHNNNNATNASSNSSGGSS